MTPAELVQFYAPFVGLLGVVFMLGRTMEKLSSHTARLEKLEQAIGDGAFGERLAVIESDVRTIKGDIEKIERAQDGIMRMIGNLMNGSAGKIEHIGVDHG